MVRFYASLRQYSLVSDPSKILCIVPGTATSGKSGESSTSMYALSPVFPEVAGTGLFGEVTCLYPP